MPLGNMAGDSNPPVVIAAPGSVSGGEICATFLLVYDSGMGADQATLKFGFAGRATVVEALDHVTTEVTKQFELRSRLHSLDNDVEIQRPGDPDNCPY